MRSAIVSRILTLGLTLAGFAAALALYLVATGGTPAAMRFPRALFMAVLSFWLLSEFWGTDEDSNASAAFLEHLSLTTGINLIVQALLGYSFDAALLPLPVLVGGGAMASAFLALWRAFGPFAPERRRSGLLLIGYDPAAADVARSGGQPVVGVIDADASHVPPSLPLLGPPGHLAAVAPFRSLAGVMIASPDWESRVPLATLMGWKLDGVPVGDVPSLYEKTLRRVCYARLNTSDLLFSPTVKTGRHIMAIQAVYTDLMGLVFLILLSPVLVLTGIAVALFSGPGPILERIECLGLQNVPFELLRFRTRSSRTGALTRIGERIARMHLVNLPQLINIIRGEVVFFGPRPVRKEFAERLAQLLPFYSYKFSVKPGVLGWAQANLPLRSLASETMRLEYDFYYIRRSSLALDFEILVRTFFGGKRQPESGEVTP